MFSGQLNCALKIGGVCINLNSVREHPLGQVSDFVALIKLRLQVVVHFGK
jgi:hypothetical protein